MSHDHVNSGVGYLGNICPYAGVAELDLSSSKTANWFCNKFSRRRCEQAFRQRCDHVLKYILRKYVNRRVTGLRITVLLDSRPITDNAASCRRPNFENKDERGIPYFLGAGSRYPSIPRRSTHACLIPVQSSRFCPSSAGRGLSGADAMHVRKCGAFAPPRIPVLPTEIHRNTIANICPHTLKYLAVQLQQSDRCVCVFRRNCYPQIVSIHDPSVHPRSLFQCLQLEGKYSLESTDPRESEIRAHLRP